MREADSGIVVAGDDREALAAAMVEMASAPIERRRQWARNGYRHLQEHYTPRILAGLLAEGLDSVTR